MPITLPMRPYQEFRETPGMLLLAVLFLLVGWILGTAVQVKRWICSVRFAVYLSSFFVGVCLSVYIGSGIAALFANLAVNEVPRWVK